MNTYADKTQENKSQSVANEVTQKKRGSESTFQFVDNRPIAITQRKLQGMADNSSQVRQLRAFQEMSSISGGDPVAQLTSLNGRLVDEATPYPNANQAAVLTHMAGEWDGAANHAVTGGHLLNEMVTEWGPAAANSIPNNASAAGVHFTGGIPGDNITPHQHEFRLATPNAGNGQTAVSLAKQSTFWPSGWNNASLISTLNTSFRNGPANTWACKQNMSYWYRWQTLGANTLFPIEKVATVTGTDRNKMKAGRL